MFGVVDRSQGGDPIRACADDGCHGVQSAGQPASNGSDLPLLSEAFGDARLDLNFVSATGFVNFIDPGESSLFLYPTNEIANRAAHPLATGNLHPGGYGFAADSAAARTILTWAAGLRPDGEGYQRNWLVMGDFVASRISDPTTIDEASATPRIFDPGGGALNLGQWDGLFSADATVDLDTVLSRPATTGRVAYATSYMVNTYARPQVVNIIVTTSNPVRLVVNGEVRAQNHEAGGTRALVTLAGSGPERSARILIKLMQRPDDPQFAFRVQLQDELGTVLTDSNNGLVFTLSPSGGI
jgi:hypothetical protein